MLPTTATTTATATDPTAAKAFLIILAARGVAVLALLIATVLVAG